MKINTQAIIDAYNSGQSMNAISKEFNTYPTSIKRILERNGIELRHDGIEKGSLIVKDGEKLIKWAKAQGRPVTKAELAKIAGTKRLSPSYFIKYPELGEYIETRGQNELQGYINKLYKWLKANNIQYKPYDRTRLKVSIDALLLGEYKDIALQISIKPSCVSNKKHKDKMDNILVRSIKNGLYVIFLDKLQFEEGLDSLKTKLDSLKG